MDDVKRINRELMYEGSIVDIYSDTMQFSNGNTAKWDLVAHRKGAAAVVPVLDNGKILMVKQYRNALDRYTLEIPAGARDSVDEPTDVCAARELEEETGYRAGKIEKLITVATTVAFCNEIIDIYVATELEKTERHLDENEFVDVEEYSIEDLTDMIFSGKIQDSKTLGALLAYNKKYK
ncbi:MAG: NUDIX hydrolase [Butyrivibrio sp.]|nr:NUDIX hydrolase [Butyrivibrio sp.]